MTAQTMTIVLTIAAMILALQTVQAVVRLNRPCQTAQIRMLPSVLLYNQVKVIDPARRPTRSPGRMETSYE
jgi:hypothetical protein